MKIKFWRAIALGMALTMPAGMTQPMHSVSAKTGLRLSTKTKTISLNSKGKAKKFKLKIKKTTKKATWKSSDTSVVKVSGTAKSATVTVVGVGKANITATAGSSKATCKVTVKAYLPKEASVKAGNTKTLTLKGKGTEIKSVKSSKKAVATVAKTTAKKVTVTAKKAGTATVTITDVEGLTYTSKVTVKAAGTTSTPVATHTHSWNAGVVTKEATCTEAGVKTYTCTCGETRTEEIPAKGHTLGEWIITKEATCAAEGTKVQQCSVCKNNVNTEKIPVNDSNHEYKWSVTKAASAGRAKSEADFGERVGTCKHCGKKTTETIVNLGDDHVVYGVYDQEMADAAMALVNNGSAIKSNGLAPGAGGFGIEGHEADIIRQNTLTFESKIRAAECTIDMSHYIDGDEMNPYSEAMYENLAGGIGTAYDLINNWVASTSHKRALTMAKYGDISVFWADKDGTGNNLYPISVFSGHDRPFFPDKCSSLGHKWNEYGVCKRCGLIIGKELFIDANKDEIEVFYDDSDYSTNGMHEPRKWVDADGDLKCDICGVCTDDHLLNYPEESTHEQGPKLTAGASKEVVRLHKRPWYNYEKDYMPVTYMANDCDINFELKNGIIPCADNSFKPWIPVEKRKYFDGMPWSYFAFERFDIFFGNTNNGYSNDKTLEYFEEQVKLYGDLNLVKDWRGRELHY